jgi:phytoene synthase
LSLDSHPTDRATFASEQDFEACRRLHRTYGTTYYFATMRFPKEIRRRTHAIYGFVRVPDEWVDNPGELSLTDRKQKLDEWRDSLHQGLEGVRPDHPVMRAFVDVVREAQIDVREADLFLDAMEADLDVRRYATYDDLRGYMRASAAAVGLMMCDALGADRREDIREGAIALGEAMQLTNFLRDVGEDSTRGRLYMPLEDLDRFGVTEAQISAGQVTEGWRALMKFEIDRARALYARSDESIPYLPSEMRRAVRLARELYARILDRIESQDYDVFSKRARTTTLEKLAVAARYSLVRP